MEPVARRAHRTVASLGIGLVALLLLVAAAATPALAQSRRGSDDDSRIVITGRVDVFAEEEVDTVVIFDGPAVIEGTVDGSVVAFNGDVRISGTVDDNVVALSGRVFVEDGARIGGDVVSSERAVVAEGATVEGDVERVNFRTFFRALGWVLWFVWWLAVGVSVFVFGVLLLALTPRIFPPALDAARTRVGLAIAWGVALGIGLPIASVVVMFTVLGIPLGLLGLLSLALLYSLGYVVAALFLGRKMIREPRSPHLAFLVGLVVLRVVDLVPVLGNLVTLAAAIFGLGALAVAAWNRARPNEAARSPEPAPVA